MPRDDGYIQIIEANLGEEAMQGVDRKVCYESNYQPERYPFVGTAPGIHVLCETTPSYGLGVK